MAVDEALLDGHSPYDFTLRFYRWIRPTVSLGYAQPWARGFDPEVARRQGVGLVRRPTGGRAVLHDDELTYAVAAPSRDGPLAGGVLETYRRLAEGLAGGLRELGAAVDLVRMGGATGGSGPGDAKPAEAEPTSGDEGRGEGSAAGACFSARSRYEVLHRGRKVVGSAQRRRQGRLLQHGSLLLGFPEPGLWRALGPGGEEAAAASTGLQAVLEGRPSLRRTAATVARAVGEALGLQVKSGELSRAEGRVAARLARRYADDDWTYRR